MNRNNDTEEATGTGLDEAVFTFDNESQADAAERALSRNGAPLLTQLGILLKVVVFLRKRMDRLKQSHCFTCCLLRRGTISNIVLK